MDITNELRSKCGHDSRDVDGCVNCEASTLIESMRQQLASRDAEIAELNHRLEEMTGRNLVNQIAVRLQKEKVAELRKDVKLLREFIKGYANTRRRIKH